MLNSSDRGGIRIQYSRNPFGKKRDYDGSFINTPTAATYTAPAYEQSAVAPPTYGSGGATAAAYSSGDYSAPATAAAAPGTEQTNGAAAGYEAQPGKLKLALQLCNTQTHMICCVLRFFDCAKRMWCLHVQMQLLCWCTFVSYCVIKSLRALCRGTRRLMSREVLNSADSGQVQLLLLSLLLTTLSNSNLHVQAVCGVVQTCLQDVASADVPISAAGLLMLLHQHIQHCAMMAVHPMVHSWACSHCSGHAHHASTGFVWHEALHIIGTPSVDPNHFEDDAQTDDAQFWQTPPIFHVHLCFTRAYAK